MASDIMRGYPDRCLMKDYVAKPSEGIVDGQFVKLNTDNELELADNTAGEYAMMAFTKQKTNAIYAGSDVITCIRGNAIMWTSYYTADSYTPDCKLQINGSVPGSVKKHTGDSSPIVGRYVQGPEKVNGTYMIAVDLVRI